MRPPLNRLTDAVHGRHGRLFDGHLGRPISRRSGSDFGKDAAMVRGPEGIAVREPTGLVKYQTA